MSIVASLSLMVTGTLATNQSSNVVHASSITKQIPILKYNQKYLPKEGHGPYFASVNYIGVGNAYSYTKKYYGNVGDKPNIGKIIPSLVVRLNSHYYYAKIDESIMGSWVINNFNQSGISANEGQDLIDINIVANTARPVKVHYSSVKTGKWSHMSQSPFKTTYKSNGGYLYKLKTTKGSKTVKLTRTTKTNKVHGYKYRAVKWAKLTNGGHSQVWAYFKYGKTAGWSPLSNMLIHQ